MALQHTYNKLNASNQLITIQKNVDYGNDGRSWRFVFGANIVDAKVLDDFTIGIWLDNVYQGKSPVINVSDLSHITIFADRLGNNIYIVYKDQTSGNVKVIQMSVSTRVFNYNNTIGAGISTIPLNCPEKSVSMRIAWCT